LFLYFQLHAYYTKKATTIKTQDYKTLALMLIYNNEIQQKGWVTNYVNMTSRSLLIINI